MISPPFKGLLREPIGLYYLAGVLEEEDISVKIMDFNVEQPSRSYFHNKIRKLDPKIVGVTSYTFNFSAAKKIVKEIKKVKRDCIIVMGGVHVSSLPKETFESVHELDFIVIGEGEFTFLELCRSIINCEDDAFNIEGVAYKDNERVIINPPRRLIKNLDDLPMPNRELLPFNKYPVASVQTSRGCPYNCIFCNINKFYGNRIRFRDPIEVVKECEYIVKRYNKDKIFFFGDAFTFKSDWVETFCDEIVRRKLKFKWGCETRVDNVNYKLLKKMRRAGCIEIQYGIEYGDEEILKILGKNISLEDVHNAVRWAKKTNMFVGGFVIFNVPYENEETMEKTFRLLQRVPVDAIEINLLTPYPGTILWKNPEIFNMRIINYDFDYYTTKKYVMENLNFPREKFVPAFKRLLKRLNLIPMPGHEPEIFNFLKRDIKIKVWKEEESRIKHFLKILKG